MSDVDGTRLGIMFDDYTLDLEKLYLKQCKKRGETKPNRSHIIRNEYRKFLKKNIIANDGENAKNKN